MLRNLSAHWPCNQGSYFHVTLNLNWVSEQPGHCCLEAPKFWIPAEFRSLLIKMIKVTDANFAVQYLAQLIFAYLYFPPPTPHYFSCSFSAQYLCCHFQYNHFLLSGHFCLTPPAVLSYVCELINHKEIRLWCKYEHDLTWIDSQCHCRWWRKQSAWNHILNMDSSSIGKC